MYLYLFFVSHLPLFNSLISLIFMDSYYSLILIHIFYTDPIIICQFIFYSLITSYFILFYIPSIYFLALSSSPSPLLLLIASFHLLLASFLPLTPLPLRLYYPLPLRLYYPLPLQ